MIQLTATNGKTSYNQDEYVVDAVEDLDEILKHKSAAMGSTAFVIETSQVFMLNGEGEWKEI